ncbi:MAG: ATP-binding protein [Bacteroidales bacterium]
MPIMLICLNVYLLLNSNSLWELVLGILVVWGIVFILYLTLAFFKPSWRPFFIRIKAYEGIRNLLKFESIIAWSARLDSLGIIEGYVFEGDFEKLTGFPSSTFKNLPEDFEKLLSPEGQTERRIALSEMVTGQRERWEGEYRLQTATGEIKWLREQIYSSRTHDKKWLLGGIIIPNTAVHPSQNQLKKAEGFLHAIINALQQPLFIKNEARQYILVNKAFCQLMGKPEEELIGKTDEDLFTKEQANLFVESDKSVLARTVDTYETEVQLGNKSAYYYIIKTLYYNAEEKAKYIIGLMTDLTARKHQDEELKRALERAELAMRSKSMFLASMSHEIRTPMNSILGMAEILSDTRLDEEQREYVEVINQAGLTLLSIINDILDLSKLEAGRVTLNNTNFKLGEIIEEVIAMLRYRADEKGLQLNSDIDAILQDTPLLADPYRIRQVLINLINNALKFTPQGSVKIEARVLDYKSTRVNFIVKVIDTGIGIPESEREKVFEAFRQSSLTEGAALEGTGLGLTISKSLVELMGGTMGFESTEGEGSTFWFSLNLPVAHQGVTASSKILAKMPKVLIVEDNSTNQQLVISYLQKLGITQWDIAYTGKDAVDLVSGKLYDLILMDIQMPVMDGIEATQQIRRIERDRPLSPPARILAMTAYSSSVDKQKFIRSGMDGMLRKPFLYDDLRKEIEQLLGDQFFTSID